MRRPALIRACQTRHSLGSNSVLYLGAGVEEGVVDYPEEAVLFPPHGVVLLLIQSNEVRLAFEAEDARAARVTVDALAL